MIKSNTITVIAPNAKAQAMWVTMWAALLNVLYSLGFKVEAFEQPAAIATPKPKRTQKAKPSKPVEPTTVEIPFIRKTYYVRGQLKELGATSDRTRKVWIVPAAVADQARALVAPKSRRSTKPAPVVNVTPAAPVIRAPIPLAKNATPAEVEIRTVSFSKPSTPYIGKPRAEFSSWLADRGYRAAPVARPTVQAEPAPVASLPPAPAVKAPAARKVTASPKAPDARPLDERLAAIAEHAEPPSRRQIGRHLVWLREIRLEDLKAAVQGMSQKRVDRRDNMLFIAGDETSAAVPVRALKRLIRLSAKWKAYGLYMNSTLGLMARYDGKWGNSGHLILRASPTPARVHLERDYVVSLPNDRESRRVA